LFRSLRALWLMIVAAFQADRREALAAIALTVIENSGLVLLAFELKLLADAAVQRDERDAVLAIGLLAVTLTATHLTNLAGFAVRNTLRERTTLLVESRLAALSARIPGLEHLEHPEYLKELDLLRWGYAELARAQQSAVVTLGWVVRLTATIGLLAQVHPLLLLLPLFGVPALVQGGRAQRRYNQMAEQIAEARRLEGRFYHLATSATAAKEVRIFGLGSELLSRHRRIRADVDQIEDRRQLRSTAEAIIAWLVFATGFVGTVAFVADRAARQEATLGDVVLTLTLAAQVNMQVGGLVTQLADLLRALKMAGRYVWLLDYAEAAAREEPLDPVPPPDRLQHGIDLEQVSFQYPGTDRNVLADVSLHLPAGATVAIVGENGAGKTTLVKLLARYYEPTTGRIVVDGTDLRRFSFDAWRERTSAGFQDFARFEILARENVGVGDIGRIDDDRAVEAALERAHAADLVATLPNGLATQLGRTFDGGTELSGGQWQKLALGRAMMRTSPLLLILDEPTAALDAQTEHALFERYAGSARRVAAANDAITILVSHRFSTVRMADLIVVIADHGVAELGSHEELIAAGGLYAELYELQARAYR
jgi:ATP-binding cassette subfamily B protein